MTKLYTIYASKHTSSLSLSQRIYEMHHLQLVLHHENTWNSQCTLNMTALWIPFMYIFRLQCVYAVCVTGRGVFSYYRDFQFSLIWRQFSSNNFVLGCMYLCCNFTVYGSTYVATVDRLSVCVVRRTNLTTVVWTRLTRAFVMFAMHKAKRK